jgi:hypothetical protein
VSVGAAGVGSQEQAEMKPEVITALLVGFFALGGAFGTSLFNLLGNQSKAKHELDRELRSKHFDRKFDAYQRLAEICEPFFLTGCSMPSVNDVRAMYRELLFVASSDVIASFNVIGDTSPEKLAALGLTSDQVKARRTEVAQQFYNAMRADLFPGQSPLAPHQIRFLEPKSVSRRNEGD